MFSSQSRSKILQIRSQLSREKKGDSSASAYYSKMKGLADEMAAAGKKFDDDGLIGYILNGLDSDYNPFVSSVSVKDSLSLSDLYAQLLSYEARLNQQRGDERRFYSSANVASRGRGRNGPRRRGRGFASSRGASGAPPGRGQGPSGSYDSEDAPICQLCERAGHTVHDCWYRFNKKYVPPRDGGSKPMKTGTQKSPSTVGPSYGVDTNWYFDSGATNHITNDLDKLATREHYNGQDQIHAANGKGTSISHVGETIFHTPNHAFLF